MKKKIVHDMAEYITRILGYPVEIDGDTSLKNDIGLDSLDAADLVGYLERTYGFDVPDSELLIFHKTVGEIANYICDKVNDGSQNTSQSC